MPSTLVASSSRFGWRLRFHPSAPDAQLYEFRHSYLHSHAVGHIVQDESIQSLFLEARRMHDVFPLTRYIVECERSRLGCSQFLTGLIDQTLRSPSISEWGKIGRAHV